MLKIIEVEVMIDGEGFTQRSGAAQVKYVVLSGEAAHDLLNRAPKGKLRGKITGRLRRGNGNQKRTNRRKVFTVCMAAALCNLCGSAVRVEEVCERC